MHAANLGIRKVQFLHGAGHADVTQPAFLLQTAGGLFDRTLVWKQPVLHAGDEHQRELQALGRVQGHQLHAVVPAFALGLAGLQRRVAEKGLQLAEPRIGVLLRHEVGIGRVDQLAQILHAGLHAFLGLFGIVVGQSALVDHALHLVAERPVLHPLPHALDQPDEVRDGGAGPRGENALGEGGIGGLPQGKVRDPGLLPELRHRLCADGAGRLVDHAFQGRVVVGVVEQAQVGQGVLDLGAFKKALAAVDPVGDVLAQQIFLEQPRLGGGAVEHGRLVGPAPAVDPLPDALDDEPRLVLFVVRRVKPDRLAGGAGRPQLLPQPRAVVCDQSVGGLQNGAR